MSVDIDGLADEAAGHVANVFFPGREQADARAAERQRHAERGAVDDDDIRAHLPRRLQRAERHRLGHRDHQQRADGAALGGERGVVREAAEEVRGLHDDAGMALADPADQILDADRIGIEAFDGKVGEAQLGFDHLGVVRVHAARDQHRLAPRDARSHQRGFRASGGGVVHRGVGDLHPGEQAHLGLELEQRLQRALRDFGLVRRVAGEEFAALDQGVHRRRNVVAIRPRPQERRRAAGRDVAHRELGKGALDRDLALVVGQVEDRAVAHRLRHVDEQILDPARTDRRQHVAAVVGAQRQIAHYSRPSRNALYSARVRRSSSSLSSVRLTL